MAIQEQMLRKIIEGVSNTFGDNFFTSISLQLADIIQTRYVFIALLDRTAYESRTIALVVDGAVQDNIAYSLEHTPCADVGNDTICCYPCDVSSFYPDDQLLKDLNIDAYLGTPLRDSRGEVMGLIVAMDDKPIADTSQVLTLFEIFSGRVSAEVERQQYERSLEQANLHLESTVKKRTSELTTTLEKLKQAQSQLVESEKMAALGNLVAGVAHEVNTPLGVAITAQSLMQEELHQLNEAVTQETLTEAQMMRFLANMQDTLGLQDKNLQRARVLIENFKRTAVDQHALEIETIDIQEYYQQTLSSLQPLLKSAHADVMLSAATPVKLATYPGCHAQILTNLISNSVKHGFRDRDTHNQIQIVLSQLDDGQIKVQYRDNGCGLDEVGQKQIFEPFYTTIRSEGGTGLGMSIVYNLITQRLHGNVVLEKSDTGFALSYTFSPEK